MSRDHPRLSTTIHQGSDDAEPRYWGLIRETAKTIEQAKWQWNHALFARAEEVFDRDMYRDIALTQRCLIWVESFNEHHHAPGGKIIPHRLQMRDRSLISFGGLWSTWQNPNTNRWVHTCNIFTTETNELLAQVHNAANRMPLIIPPQQRNNWLDLKISADKMKGLMQPLSAGLLEATSLKALPLTLF